MQKENNYAFIDGQNLHMGTTKTEPSWKEEYFDFLDKDGIKSKIEWKSKP